MNGNLGDMSPRRRDKTVLVFNLPLSFRAEARISTASSFSRRLLRRSARQAFPASLCSNEAGHRQTLFSPKASARPATHEYGVMLSSLTAWYPEITAPHTTASAFRVRLWQSGLAVGAHQQHRSALPDSGLADQ